MRQIYAFILSLVCISSIYSQERNQPLVHQGAQVIIERTAGGVFQYTHVFEKDHTVYSLARVFQVKAKDIYKANNLPPQSPIRLGQVVKVPFDISAIYTEETSNKISSSKFVPVYYVAKPKETLYGIAKTYFSQDLATFADRNKIKNNKIAINQQLLIGWLPVLYGNPVIVSTETKIAAGLAKKETPASTISPASIIEAIEEAISDTSAYVIKTDLITNEALGVTEETTDTLTVVEEVVSPTTVTRRTRGIGIWERDSKVNGRSFVLHHTAKKGSYIELYNPQLNLRTTAKVLGRIPLNTYPSDVSVIMSKKVADSLGALDTRFMVELKFVEDIK